MRTLAIIFAVAQFLVPAALAQTKPAVELEGAIAKEQVDGDLKTAIAAYQKIAADTSATRDTRAKALLHVAGCYEKLGRQAQTVYKQIVHDFPDQPAAVQALARLAAFKQGDRADLPETMTQRKVGMFAPDIRPWDTDGKRAVYWNQSLGELLYADLRLQSKRVLYKANGKSGSWLFCFPSRDFSKIAILLEAGGPQSEYQTLAILNRDGTGYHEIAKLPPPFDFADEIRITWSWDNRYLFYREPSGGVTRLLRISSATGEIVELLTQKKAGIKAVYESFLGAFPSPDGRLIAYEVLAGASATASQILIQKIDGGKPNPLYNRPPFASGSLSLLDWTKDGHNLIASLKGTEKPALYLLPVKDGSSGGDPVFLRYGGFEKGLTTSAGTLIYSSVKPGGNWALYLASLDSKGRPGEWKRLNVPLGNIGNPTPSWSADSSEIAYLAGDDSGRNEEKDGIRLYKASTGKDQEIYRGRAGCVWAAREPKLFCADRSGLFSLITASGEVARLRSWTGTGRGYLVNSYPTQDGRGLYLRMMGESGDSAWKLVRWDAESREETLVAQGSYPYSEAFISRNERWLTRLAAHAIEIRPTAGADWKYLISPSRITGHYNISPDGKWLLYHDVDSFGRHGLFRISTNGGPAERLGEFPADKLFGSLEISPDGAKVIVSAQTGPSGYELWSLENFVPPAAKQPKGGTLGASAK